MNSNSSLWPRTLTSFGSLASVALALSSQACGFQKPSPATPASVEPVSIVISPSSEPAKTDVAEPPPADALPQETKAISEPPISGPAPEPKESEPQLTPRLTDDSGVALAQTDQKPSQNSPLFQANARLLFEAIVADDVEKAMPFFFPLVAYEQVKDIVDPKRDWEERLKAAYKKDIHAYHRTMGKFRAEASYVELRVAQDLAKWVAPGGEVNKVGYYRVMRSVLVYKDNAGRSRELGIITMISWRGEWYVVHLAPFK